MRDWNEKRLKQLKRQKKIRDYQITERNQEKNFNRVPKSQKRSEAKDWMMLNLQYWCNERALTLLTEHIFDQDQVRYGITVEARLWRFDFAIPAHMIAIEYEGIFSEKSRHTTFQGFTGDAKKYNRANELGWRVLRFTAKNYKDLIQTLNNCIS